MSTRTPTTTTGPRGTSYERIIEWVAGPSAILAGAIAVWFDNHFGILGKAGLGHDQTAKAIFDCVTFGVGALLTWAAHNKFLSNVPKWWATQAAAQTVGYEGAVKAPSETLPPGAE